VTFAYITPSDSSDSSGSATHRRMVTSCHKKCVVKHNENELQVGEMACVDRCVGKYNQTQELVGSMLYKFEQDMVAKEKAAGGKPGAK
jgi:hypothetical protein